MKSFVDIERIYRPKGTVDGINEYLTYRIKNAQSNNYIKTNAQNGAVLGAADSVLSTEFSIILADDTRPIYRLVSCDNSLELRLDSNHNLTFDATQAQNNSQYWFIIPKEERYLLINFAELRKTLGNCGRTTTTATCGTSYLEYGNLWEITPMIRIKSFYDLGYKARKGTNAASELHDIQEEIGDIVSAVFGVETAIPSPYAMVSHADSCHGSDLTSISVAQADAACGRSPTNDDPCNDYNTLGSVPGSSVHHKNAYAVLYHFKESSYNNPYRYELLYSGHKACGKDSTTNEHDTDVLAGLGNVSTPGVGEVLYIGSSKEYRLRLTGLHELSHMLGATGGSVDSLHYEDSSGKGMCVMSGSRNNAELLRYWQQGNFSALYCPTCKGLIANHLQITLEEE